MYSDSTKLPIKDTDQYTSPDTGNQYSASFPKDQIPGLYHVTEVAAPNDPQLVVTGFIIDNTYTQVWQTRNATDNEKAAALLQIKNQKLSDLKKHRYSVQTAGLTISGIVVPTDEVSVNRLSDLWTKAKLGATFTIEWVVPGGPYQLTQDLCVALGDAVFTFWQKCYSAEAYVITSNVDNYASSAATIAAFDARMAS